MLKNIIGIGATLMIALMITACGGGSSSDADTKESESSADCSGVTTDENSCYLGYISLSANDKACCDAWIATQK
ncbi:MAG: hypothetical protein U9N52_07330 [Campylobacterota bacterium]|nr:hypothetical protein [Campylobacterota bacterium]